MAASLNEHGFYDIYQPWHIPFWQTRSFYITCVVFVLLVVGLCIWLIVKRYKNKKQNRTPWEHALEVLDKLRMYSMRPEDAKNFYFVMTTTVKNYVHERYQLPTADKTDVEFLDYLRQQQFDTRLVEQLTALFNGSVAVRFADDQAAREQMEQDMQRALAFVRCTIPEKNI